MEEKEDMIELIKKFPEDIIKTTEMSTDIRKGKFAKVVVCGMGGSAIPGDILRDVLDDDIGIEVVRNYELPKHIGKESLIFIISYSGNTFETISCYEEAKKRKCKIIVLASGGKLEEKAIKDKIDFIKVPSGYEPRLAIVYQFFYMLRVVAKIGIIKNKDKEIIRTGRIIKKLNKRIENEAEKLANKLKNKIPLIYTSNSLKSTGYILKIQFNETSKTPCFSNKFTELFHNEIEILPIRDFFPILILDKENNKVEKQMNFFRKILGQYYELKLKGSKMEKIFQTIYFGELLTYYLAKELGKDPREYVHIENLKKIG